MTDDSTGAEAREARRAAEDELIRERNAAQRDAGEGSEQALILPGEPDAAAVTGLGDEAGGDLRGVDVPSEEPTDESPSTGGSSAGDDDIDRTVDLGGRDD